MAFNTSCFSYRQSSDSFRYFLFGATIINPYPCIMGGPIPQLWGQALPTGPRAHLRGLVHLEVPCAFSRHAWVALHTVFGSFVLFCFGCGSRGPTCVPAWVGERFSLLGGGGVLRNIGFAILSMDCNVRHKETLQWDPLGWASDESSANPASPSSPARPGSPASQLANSSKQYIR